MDELKWHKSTRSAGIGECVEVAETADTVYVRDTKNRTAGNLRFDAAQWSAFVAALKADELNG